MCNTTRQRSEETFYKWSNDNDVYTELAHPGLIYTDDGGVIAVFAGEQPSLDNGMANGALNAARNLAFVKVPFDLRNKTAVLSDGTVNATPPVFFSVKLPGGDPCERCFADSAATSSWCNHHLFHHLCSCRVGITSPSKYNPH